MNIGSKYTPTPLAVNRELTPIRCSGSDKQSLSSHWNWNSCNACTDNNYTMARQQRYSHAATQSCSYTVMQLHSHAAAHPFPKWPTNRRPSPPCSRSQGSKVAPCLFQHTEHNSAITVLSVITMLSVIITLSVIVM